jgi:hypothetical protein
VGVCLYFTMGGPISMAVEDSIRRELPSAISGRLWLLCEPPWFFPPEEGQPLRGRTKLNGSPGPEEAREHRGGPEPDDLEALVELLCAWSARYDVAWVVDIDGRRLGHIAGGKCGWCLARRIRATADALRRKWRAAGSA